MSKEKMVNVVKEVLSKKNIDVTKVAAGELVEAIFSSISEELGKGGEFAIKGFGTFKVSQRAERTALNPKTKEKILVPARKVPVFKAASKLKEKVL